MPFPTAHPAAVLPLRRYCPRLFNFPALIIGSLVPDLGYPLARFYRQFGDTSHTFYGSFVFCLPAGLLATLLSGLAADYFWIAPGGFGIADPAAQTETAMKNVKILLEEAGAKLDHICKITVYITDRAYRDPIYRVIGKWLKGVYPVSTGLIVQGLAKPELLMEIDVDAVIPEEGA